MTAILECMALILAGFLLIPTTFAVLLWISRLGDEP